MKSQVPQINYIELPLKVFLKRFPQFYCMIPPVLDINDNDYIVRIKDGKVEFGYASDNWVIK